MASRRRAEALRERHAFAAEVLALYLALLDVWEEAWAAARAAAPAPDGPEALAGWAAERVLPHVVRTTVAAGPEPLAKALVEIGDDDLRGAGRELLTAWLGGAELDPLERYLARAALRGPLEAVDRAAVCARGSASEGDRRCPTCGGPPQLSFRTDTADRLVSGRRRLWCARCAASWNYSSSMCPSCGESSGSKRTLYFEHPERHGESPRVGRGPDNAGDADAAGGGADTATFPHLRIESCTSCLRYLIDVDLGRDPRAVPEVDELAALPLDMYAAERGISKITPNLMGF
ncbi:MAG TPA: formate dehydrogenase accessory protein FdhE [Streptosporangiaceae bacterium]|nr:formate dehydrogenase accessory protein FdhE [Streptosporangiaceae bacterium]